MNVQGLIFTLGGVSSVLNVAQYNDELSQALNAFDGDWAGNRLQGFRDAEVMIGFVTTVMGKSGLTD